MFNLPATEESAAEDLSQFRKMRSAVMETAAIRQKKILSIAVDEEFFREINDLKSQVRFISSGGSSLPFALTRAAAPAAITNELQLPGKIIRSQKLSDGRNAVDFELESDNRKVSVIELIGGKFQPGAHLSIAVGDGRNWQTALKNVVLPDISALPESVNRRFPLPEPLRGKFVRLILDAGDFQTLEALRIYESITRIQPDVPQQKQYPLQEISQKRSGNTLNILYHADSVPLVQLKITFSSKLYLCKVMLLGSNDRREWFHITAGTLRKIHQDQADTLDFPEIRCKYLQLKIELHPETVPETPEIKAVGSVYFWQIPAASGNENLNIYYGTGNLLPEKSFSAAAPEAAAADYRLLPAQDNILHKTGVSDRSSWRHLIGALFVLLTLFTLLAVFGELKRSGKYLPAD